MKKNTIYPILAKVNSRLHGYDLGKLQHLRKEIIGLSRLASKKVFLENPASDRWVIHYGGRTELQFNIGLEDRDSGDEARFGVAFSLARSQSLQDIGELFPKIDLFNDYLENNIELLSDMKMWHFKKGKDASNDYKPSAITGELAKEGTFIFLGTRQKIESIDYDYALDLMNRLLPLYLYTMSKGKVESVKSIEGHGKFSFIAGNNSKLSMTSATLAERKINIELRHNDMQKALWEKLAKKYGENNTGTEISSGGGTSVDVVVRQNKEYCYYEIKTAPTPKACIRHAIGQLLEYSYWPDNQQATKLIVVGREELDSVGKKYLATLRDKFSLPISYESIPLYEREELSLDR